MRTKKQKKKELSDEQLEIVEAKEDRAAGNEKKSYDDDCK